jgi:glycosyltransferase involved in cell wall biosynthesis
VRKQPPKVAERQDFRTGFPLVSVLTPSFNQALWLADNLRSVASQTYEPIEHIVMDGGSSDGSVDILTGNDRPGLTWRSERDTGQSHALNKAFAVSRGEVIGWLNSDDAYCDRRAVEWAVAAFHKHPEIDVVYGYALLADEVNTVLQVIASPPFNRLLLRAINYIYQPTVFVRRRALRSEPYFVREDLRYVMDRDLWMRLSAHSGFHRLPVPTAIDRHQRNRKVLTTGFIAELDAFNASLGIRPSASSAFLTALVGLYMRLVGLIVMMLLPRRIERAIGLRIPRFRKRVWQQVAVRRRHFLHDSDR